MVGQYLHGVAKKAYLGIRDERGTKLSRTVTQTRRFVENEVGAWGEGWLSMPLERRLWLWRHGFLSRADVLYDVTEENRTQYLSDYQRERAAWINGDQRIMLDDKLIFHWMMEPFDTHRVAIYGLLKDGRFHDVGTLRPATDGSGPMMESANSSTPHETNDPAARIGERLRREDTLVLKPCRGSGGQHVMFCSFADSTYHINGEKRTPAEFESVVTNLDNYLVSEAVEQADYARELFPKSVNAMRLQTMYDEVANEPYLAAAEHKIGTERSAPLDNVGRGGLFSKVDRETGKLTAAVSSPRSGTLDFHDTHPDTGTRIEGIEVPGWSAIRDGILDMVAAFSPTPYIGWDIVVTDDGEFTVLEANNSGGVEGFQTYRPLLADPRVRRFYERHGVV